jgi:putative ABC transport system ATP-binding protein
MFSIENLSHVYQQKTVLQIQQWVVNQGEQWLLRGNSGSGKTTFLHILAGLQQATSGKVLVSNTEIGQLSGTKLDKFRGQNIGIIFQQPYLIKTLTAIENLLLANYMAGKRQDKKFLIELLTHLNISALQHKFPHQLSIGELQRLCIARALANQPKLLLADEPTSALDDQNTKAVIDLIKTQASFYNTTLVIATHDNRLENEFEKCKKL